MLKTKVKGLRELGRKIDRLPKTLQTTVIRPAMKKVGLVISKRAKQNAPVDTGVGRRNIGFSVSKMKGETLGLVTRVGLKQTGGRQKKRVMLTWLKGRKRIKGRKINRKIGMIAFWMRYQELGHYQTTGKGNTQRHFITGRPWLEPALRQTQSQCVSILKTETEKNIAYAVEAAARGVG